MTRIVIHHEQAPQPIPKQDVPGDSIWACRCGLSSRAPLCDGSHKITRDEQPGLLYQYERRDGQLVRTAAPSVPVPIPQEIA
jgi:CDGSH-type Zn-finger protein